MGGQELSRRPTLRSRSPVKTRSLKEDINASGNRSDRITPKLGLSRNVLPSPRPRELISDTPRLSRTYSTAKREASPTKLPLGSLQRSQSMRQSSPTKMEKTYGGLVYRRPPGKPEPLATPARPTSRDSTRDGRPRSRRLSGIPIAKLSREKEREIATAPASSQLQCTRTPRAPVSAPIQDARGRRSNNTSDLKSALGMERQLRTPANAAAKMQRPSASGVPRKPVPVSTKDLRETQSAPSSSTPPEPAPHPTSEALAENLELLQLHVLYRQAIKAQQQWKRSAEAHYEKQFQGLASRATALRDRQTQEAEQRSTAAILKWCNADGGTIEHKLATLSRIIAATDRLASPESAYTALIRAFEHWYDELIGRQQQGRRLTSRQRPVSEVAEGLGDGWKAEARAQQGAIVGLAFELLELGASTADCELTRCVTALSEMLNNMLQELEVIQGIEGDILRQEQKGGADKVEQITSGLRSL